MNHLQPSLRPRAAAPPPFAVRPLAACVLLALACGVQAAPVGGTVAAGSATIGVAGTTTTVRQTSGSAVLNWQSFGIAAGETVRFDQPGATSVALNRVTGADPSAIFGQLSANGRVFLVNPNGILFGNGASVNVGGLVASTLDISDADFMAGRYSFGGGSRASVVNQGTVTADGGWVALLGAEVSNQGVIAARMGHVVLAGGEGVTLDVAGDRLLNVKVDRGAVNALVHNGGLIQADGGQVLLTAQAAAHLLSTVVNNTGVIRARTIDQRAGTIKLLGDMDSGTMTVAGTLDASAPAGGNGGFIETSAARVRVQDGARVTTAAPAGRTGEWLIDPQDFTIGSGATDNISGATLSALLVTNSVVISTAPGPDATIAGTPPVRQLNTANAGNGDIHVNEAISWTATPSTTTLTLNAVRDVNINAAITAVNGNLVACCGRDVNVNAALTTTNGSVLIGAGRHAILSATAPITTTDGNMMVCAANDVRIGAALTLTRGAAIAAQGLGLPTGMTLSAGNGGTGPGAAAGTVLFAPLAPPAVVTGPNAPVRVVYSPSAYDNPTDFSGQFVLSGGATLTQQKLVFPVSPDKPFDGSTATTLAGLKGNPPAVTLVAGPGATANFDTPTVGAGKTISFTGYTLAGPGASSYALPLACCGPAVGKTTGNLLAAVIAPVVVAPIPVPVPIPVAAPVPAGSPLPGGTEPGAVPTPLLVPVPLLVDLGTDGGASQVMPQFAPFVVAPALLRAPGRLLTVAPASAAPMDLVLVQAPAPPPPAPAAQAAPPPAPALPVPPRLPPKPFRH